MVSTEVSSRRRSAEASLEGVRDYEDSVLDKFEHVLKRIEVLHRMRSNPDEAYLGPQIEDALRVLESYRSQANDEWDLLERARYEAKYTLERRIRPQARSDAMAALTGRPIDEPLASHTSTCPPHPAAPPRNRQILPKPSFQPPDPSDRSPTHFSSESGLNSPVRDALINSSPISSPSRQDVEPNSVMFITLSPPIPSSMPSPSSSYQPPKPTRSFLKRRFKRFYDERLAGASANPVGSDLNEIGGDTNDNGQQLERRIPTRHNGFMKKRRLVEGPNGSDDPEKILQNPLEARRRQLRAPKAKRRRRLL